MADARYDLGQPVGDYATKTMHKFGGNADIATSYETLWPEGGLKAFRTTEATMTISSSDANDTSAGSGAQTVKIQGVDENWEEVSETLSMNGQTAVPTVNSYMVVHRMIVETGGATGWNEGIVYVGTGGLTAGKPAVVECLVSIGENQSEVAFYAVPYRYSLIMTQLHISASSGKDVTCGIYTMPVGGVFNLRGKVLTPASHVHHTFHPTVTINPKTIVQIKAKVDSTTADVQGGFDGYLVRKHNTG